MDCCSVSLLNPARHCRRGEAHRSLMFYAMGSVLYSGRLGVLRWSAPFENPSELAWFKFCGTSRRCFCSAIYFSEFWLTPTTYPFGVTLARSTLWSNFKQSELVPFKMFLHRYWLELLIEKVAVFAAIGYLILINLQRRWRTGAGLAWLLCSAVACAIEIGKLFFAARAFYSDNVIMASLGGLLGIILLPSLSALGAVKRHRQIIWFMLVLGFLFYFELSPFDWISPSELTGRFSRIEWLPFKAYYSTEPLIALFDLQKKIYSLIPLGFVVMSLGPVQHTDSPRRKATMLCMAIAAALELAQIAVRSRTPSSTDVIIFTASAWAGIVVFEGCRSFRRGNDVSRDVV